MSSSKRNTCRACGSDRLRLIFDFGPQPLAGMYPLVPESERPAPRYPLDLTQCDACALLQVTNLPPIDAVFHDDYRYASSTVPDLVQHFTGYADWLTARLPAGAEVLEFGCNDGVLLAQLEERGANVVGVDASDNVAAIARGRGLDVRTGFMTPDAVQEQGLEGRFDLITCSNVFAHIDDLGETLAAVRRALKPDGRFAVEVHDGEALAAERQFDTIYHEHLTYFTGATLRRLVEANGFAFVECVRTPMHGGGLRFLCARGEGRSPPVHDEERIDGARFAEAIERSAGAVRALAAEYGPLDGYGVAGRSQMFVNMTGTADCFARLFDDSPLRQNRFLVGSDVAIGPFGGETGRACVVLAWNYAASISAKIGESYEKVFTVLPEPREW